MTFPYMMIIKNTYNKLRKVVNVVTSVVQFDLPYKNSSACEYKLQIQNSTNRTVLNILKQIDAV